MTHNENIKTFDALSRHLELETERLEAVRLMACLILLSLVRAGHLGRSARKIKVERMRILDLRLRRLILPSEERQAWWLRRVKLAQHALTVVRKDTSLVIALSRRRYSLT